MKRAKTRPKVDTVEELTARYKFDSYILHPENQQFGAYSKFVNFNNPEDLKREILRIQGGEKQPGFYYNSGKDQFEPCYLATLEAELVEINQRFKHRREQAKRTGNLPPKEMPSDLLPRFNELTARKLVAQREVEHLQSLIEKIEGTEPKQEVILHRRHWGDGKLENGTLISIGGHQVRPDPDQEGLLIISDPRSKYNGMPVWKFKSLIYKPMALEFTRRMRLAQKESKRTGQAFKKPSYPPPPIWNPRTDVIEYQGISNDVIKKLKKDD